MPDEVSFEQGAMLEPLGVATHAVRITPVVIGDTALLMGAGIIGLMTLQVLKNAGCAKVYVADVDDTRLELARKFGATETFDPRTDDIPAEIMKRTAGMGAQVALDAVGTRVDPSRLHLQCPQGRLCYRHRQHYSGNQFSYTIRHQPSDYPARIKRHIRRVRHLYAVNPERHGRRRHTDVSSSPSGRRRKLVQTSY